MPMPARVSLSILEPPHQRAVDEQPWARGFACRVVHNSRYFPSLKLRRQVCAHAQGPIAFAWNPFLVEGSPKPRVFPCACSFAHCHW